MAETSQNADERLKEGLLRQHHASDVILMGDFVSWYCRGNHKDRPKHEVRLLSHEIAHTPAKHLLHLCDECEEFLRYAEKRTAFCQQTPKPFCSTCSIKCYSHRMEEYSRKVMRYSGPRSLFSRHFLLALRHILGIKRQRPNSL